tara:strand:+ start:135 stop:425 length:291 start_codon:yes stop_codon:yes gene_type:complete
MSVLIKPIITEKMTAESERFNRFGFIVSKNANKIQIKQEVENVYDVKVESVRTMICIGKKRNRGTKSGFISGRTKTIKKAVVQLSEGDSIDFYSNI